MPELGPFEVRISTDGTRLNEYPAVEGLDNITPDDQYHVTTYVEATENASFSVITNINNDYKLPFDCNALTMDVRLDGSFADSIMVRAHPVRGHRGLIRNHMECKGYIHLTSDQWSLRKFRFGALDISQEMSGHNVPDLKQKVAKLGVIEVQIWTYVEDGNATAAPRPTTFNQVGTVPEKALKGRAITLNAQLGKAIKCQPRLSVQGSRKTLLATFNMLYRSRESLYQIGILERPQSPVALEDRDLDTMSASELRELVRAQKIEREQIKNLKSEYRQTVKRERSPVDDDELTELPNPKKRSVPIEVIEIDSD